MSTFSERLQKLMDVKKINQIEVAKGVGVNRSRVSEWLTGKVSVPRRKTLHKITDFFGCNVEWIATGSGEPFQKKIAQTNNSTVTTIGSFKQSAENIHQSGRDMQIHNTDGQHHLSTSEKYLLELLDQVPNKEEFIQKVIFEAMQKIQHKKNE